MEKIKISLSQLERIRDKEISPPKTYLLNRS